MNGFEVGGSGYVTKPFLAREPLARLHIHIDYHRTLHRLRVLAVADALATLGERGTDSLCQTKRWGRNQVYPSPDGPKDRH